MINNKTADILTQGMCQMLVPVLCPKPISLYVRTLATPWTEETAVQMYVDMRDHWRRINTTGVAVLQPAIKFMFECHVSLQVQRMMESEAELIVCIRDTLLSEVARQNSVFYESDPRTGCVVVKPALLFDSPSGVPEKTTCSICTTPEILVADFVWGGGNLQWVHTHCLWRLYQESGATLQPIRH